MVYNGPGYSTNFVNSITILTIITALVIMVIGNNLARAFGLVGAMSIIRFRTAVRDTLDIIFIFYALAIGMASGVGLHGTAIGGTLIVSLVIIVLVKSRMANPRKEQFLLQMNYRPATDFESEINSLLQKFCKHVKLISIKSIEKDLLVEAIFQIDIKRNQDGNELVSHLNKNGNILSVNMFFDEVDSNLVV